MVKEAAFAEAEARFLDSVGLTVRQRRIELRRLGCTIRFLEAGDGPPVVFVHGVMTAGASWAQLAAALPEFRCILLDRPGCGLSQLPANPPRTLEARQKMGDDLVADVLDALDLPSAHLVSNSLGGWYGFRSAAAHPDRIDRIVGMGFQGGARIEGAPWMMRLQTPPWMASRPRVSPGIVRHMLAMAGMRRAVESGGFSDEMLDWMVALLNHTATMRNDLVTAPRPIGLRGPIVEVAHCEDMLSRVTAPTHLFWGTDDPFGGETAARNFAARLPSATVQIAPDAGHAPWLDEPVAAVAAVRRHLA
jgi:pimeloyl-ACP methyl ester carboxylesterase